MSIQAYNSATYASKEKPENLEHVTCSSTVHNLPYRDLKCWSGNVGVEPVKLLQYVMTELRRLERLRQEVERSHLKRARNAFLPPIIAVV